MDEEKKSSNQDILEFLDKAKQLKHTTGGHGRLLFSLDATFSRQPTWDRACSLQADMFAEAGRIGGLDIKLIYFRGMSECKSTKWISDSKILGDLMGRISCRGGLTQIGKVLKQAIRETKEQKVHALVYVGDTVEEDADKLCALAGELGILGVPSFVFQEGNDLVAEPIFREIARLTDGAFFRFDGTSAKVLGELLRAIAAFAAGGRKALEDMGGRGDSGARQLLMQLK